MEKITKFVIPLIIIGLLVVGAFYFVTDVADLQMKFNTENKLFLLDLDDSIAGAFSIKGEEQPEVLFDLGKFRNFRPEKADAFAPDQMKFPAPDLIVEILSPSTEANDRGIKFLDYAAHGVAEYWIVDPDAEMIEQYTLRDKDYHLHVKTDTGTVRSTAIEGFAVPVRAVFDETQKIAAVRDILN